MKRLLNNEPPAVVIEALPDYYGIEPIVTITKLDKGQASLNYRLVDIRGNDYFLKIIAPTQVGHLPRQISFYTNIDQSLIETIQPLMTKTGTSVAVIAERRILLFPYEQLTEPVATLATAQSLGALTSCLHTTSIREQDLEPALYNPGTCLARVATLDPSAQKKYLPYLSYIEAIDCSTLPKGFVFDDICFDNIYAKDGKLRGFIDPENAGYGEFVLDIAGALIMSFFSSPNAYGLCRAFLRGYEMNRLLTELEKDQLFESLIFNCVNLSLFFEFQPGPKKMSMIDARLGFAKSLTTLGKTTTTKQLFQAG